MTHSTKVAENSSYLSLMFLSYSAYISLFLFLSLSDDLETSQKLKLFITQITNPKCGEANETRVSRIIYLQSSAGGYHPAPASADSYDIN